MKKFRKVMRTLAMARLTDPKVSDYERKVLLSCLSKKDLRNGRGEKVKSGEQEQTKVVGLHGDSRKA